MPTRLTITVPKPCHENWQAMTPVGQGRFCGNCQKQVVDFTRMTDAEVMAWMTMQKGSTCGRFRQSQLARELMTPQSIRGRGTWKAVALGLAAWLGTKTAEASASPNAPTTEQTPAVGASGNALPLQASLASDSSRVVKGVVREASTNELIPGVTIQLKGTTVTTSTDENGFFSLDIPLSYQMENPTLVFRFIGYQDHEQKIDQASFSKKITVQLASDVKGSFESVVVGGAHFSRWYTPRGLYYTVRNFFGYTVPQLFSGN